MILLTGASGFIGKHLLAALIERYGKDNVIALTSAPLTGANYMLHHDYSFGDDYFLTTNFGDHIHTVIHAGAFTPKSGKQANEIKKCNSNIFTADKLLSAHLPGLEKIIYLSTLDIYGQSDVISENSLIQPVSLYGESKWYVEKMVSAWANTNNKTHQILRVGHVYGPGEEVYQKIIPVTINKLLKGELLQIWGTGNEVRSFIYIKDIVSAILQAVELTISIGPVNLVGDQKITITGLVNKLVALSGKKTSIELIPVDVPGRNLVFDNSKMKEFLLSHETLLDEGLEEEWKYMKNLQA